MLIYTDLRDARIDQLSAAADEWQRVAELCEALESDAVNNLIAPLRTSGWAGEAATAAFARVEALDDEFEVAGLRSRTAAIVLRRAVEDFTQLQRQLQAAVEGAVAAGLSVDREGRVFPPDLGSAMRNDPDRELIHQRNVQNAGIFADLFTRILADATAADDQVARALGDLQATTYGQEAWEYGAASDGARSAAGVLGLSEDKIPAAGTDPVAVNAWWDGLSADERQIYLTAWPDRLGALDGVPAADRDTANRLALRDYIGDNVNEGRDQGNSQHDRAIYLLGRLEDGEHGQPSMYLLGLDTTGDGQAIVALGNPDTSAHTAVVVPGVGTELDEYRKEIRRAESLHNEAGALYPGTSVSVISWLGYDTPGGGGSGTDVVTAPFGAKSEAGARALDSFVDGLRAGHEGPATHVTVIGHSYGSTVVGEAARPGSGFAADDVIAAGSPGMRVDNAGQLTTGAAHTWATAAGDDNFVARPENSSSWLGIGGAEAVKLIHGPAPHDPAFGGQVLHADSHGHSGYWDSGRNILKAQVAVITGDYERAHLYGKAP
ncbi:alpha/beta hydrolase [Actinoplanes derwentensis]|uniref:Alpha/beta hydrolase n=1 Tax=Actinoplanes derwentensis TaxID=113562 RepID=A0A1H2CJ03_9ACTN|nr:alpha/beta hydrolase [Actinoplanes derwentensis]GID82566.1 hypothetical protein Ade03nite_14900 [Actinoplanes derwentensis]SDT70391.1 Alpha/beta hydrolase [Actinoplanes derwentensis]